MYTVILFRLPWRGTILSIEEGKENDLGAGKILFFGDTRWIKLYSSTKYCLQRFETLKFTYRS